MIQISEKTQKLIFPEMNGIPDHDIELSQRLKTVVDDGISNESLAITLSKSKRVE